MSKKTIAPIPVDPEHLQPMIFALRGHKVMLDSDLAVLYGVETFNLNKAVKRNAERFPQDFMFQLTKDEFSHLIFQSGISSLPINQEVRNVKSQTVASHSHGGRRTMPYAFTEQGVAMLSSALRSERAVQVNIAIMRAFVSLRGMMRSQDTIKQELTSLKRQYKNHDEQIKTIFLLIDEIIAPPAPKKKRKIGFLRDTKV